MVKNLLEELWTALCHASIFWLSVWCVALETNFLQTSYNRPENSIEKKEKYHDWNKTPKIPNIEVLAFATYFRCPWLILFRFAFWFMNIFHSWKDDRVFNHCCENTELTSNHPDFNQSKVPVLWTWLLYWWVGVYQNQACCYQ